MSDKGRKAKHTLQSHDVSSGGLHHLGNHIVNESVLVPDLQLVELLSIGGIIDLLEDILESSIVLLQDSVLGRHVQWELLLDRQLERSVGEAGDGLIGVVLSLGDSAALEVENLDLLWLSALWSEDHGELALALDDGVLGTVLVTEGVAANDDWLLPARN